MTDQPNTQRQASPERALWAAIFQAAIGDYQRQRCAAAKGHRSVTLSNVKPILLPGGTPAEKIAHVEADLRRYLASKDGQEVCMLAGMVPGERLTEAVLTAIRSKKRFGIREDRRADDEE